MAVTGSFSAASAEKLQEFLNLKSIEKKIQIQEGVNDYAGEVASEANLSAAGSIQAVGPEANELQPETGAMAGSYFAIKFRNGAVDTSSYDNAVSNAEAAAPKNLVIMGPGQDVGNTINANTPMVYAYGGNATAHGVYWEEGHFNKFIGGSMKNGGLGVFAHAPNMTGTAIGRGATEQLKAAVESRLHGGTGNAESSGVSAHVSPGAQVAKKVADHSKGVSDEEWSTMSKQERTDYLESIRTPEQRAASEKFYEHDEENEIEEPEEEDD